MDTLSKEYAYYWCGANDRDSEGDWKWIDGDTLSTEHSIWGSGEPNNVGSDEHCGVLVQSANYLMVDGNCFDFNVAVCQTQIPSCFRECDPVPSIENGTVTVSSSAPFPIWEPPPMINFTCNDGYFFVADTITSGTCSSDGTWSLSPLPTCHRAGTCDEPYNGLSYVVILTSRQWLYQRGSCEAISGMLAHTFIRTADEDTRLNMMNEIGASSELLYWVGANDSAIEGDWRWLNGERLNTSSSAWYPGQPNNHDGNQDCAVTAERFNYRMLDIDCAKERYGLCEIQIKSCFKDCGTLPSIENGRVNATRPEPYPSLYPATVLTYTCNEGYFFLDGTATTATCNRDGAWSHDAPTCHRAGSCDAPFYGFNYVLVPEPRQWEDQLRHCENISAANMYGTLAHSHLRAANESTRVNIMNEIGSIGSLHWVGANDSAIEGDWRWVDGERLSVSDPVWGRGEPNNLGNQDCGATYAAGNYELVDGECTEGSPAVCEIMIQSCFPDCPELPSLMNGNVTASASAPYKSSYPATTITYTCNSGYTFDIGVETTATCRAGNWFPSAVPVCLQTCSSLPAIGNGTVVPSNGPPYRSTPPATVLTLSCDSNFRFADDATTTSTCTSGMWQPSGIMLPVCFKDCLSLPSIGNGSVTITPDSTPYRSVAPVAVITYSCAFGYSYSSNVSTSATCTHGSWFPSTVPTCYRDCAGLPTIVNGIVTPSTSAPYKGSSPPTTINYTCNAGYSFSYGAEVMATCVDGEWLPAISPWCYRDCPSLPELMNGYVFASSNAPHTPYQSAVPAAVVNFTCNSDFMFAKDAQTSATCASGEWFPSVRPMCFQQCLFLPVIGNGSVTPSHDPPYQSVDPATTLTFSCDAGYKFEDGATTTSTCVSGMWQPSGMMLPVCYPVRCKSRARMEHGNVYCTDENFAFGSHCFHQCRRGYHFYGNSIATCIETDVGEAQWDSDVFYCRDGNPLSSSGSQSSNATGADGN